MKGLCSKCPRRATCTKLCSEAEKYVRRGFQNIPTSIRRGLHLTEHGWGQYPEQAIWDIFETFGFRQPADRWRGGPGRLPKRLWKVVERSPLTQKRKDLLRVVFWEGQTHREVAEGCGVTRQAVSYRVQTALKHLKKWLRQEIKKQEVKK